MKATFIIHSLAGGGAERICGTLATEWHGHGHDVTVVTIAGTDSDAYQLPQGVLRVALGLERSSQNPWEAAIANGSRIRVLRQIIRSHSPDVIVAMMTQTNVLTLLATRGLGVPVIVSERTHPPMYPIGRFWEALRRLTYPWAHRVVMLTQDGLGWLGQAIPAARGVVIPNPVSTPLPVSLPVIGPAEFIAPQRHLLLAAGRMDEGKQFDRLISAFQALYPHFPDWDLAILGEGPLRQALQQQADAAGLSHRVFLPGRVGNIGHWYERADLYVLSSRFEGFPNVLAEAMAHGCPVISYDCDTGPRDIIRHGVDGLLVHPVGDIPELQRALHALMGDAPKRIAMAQRASEVLKRFSMAGILERWENILTTHHAGRADAP